MRVAVTLKKCVSGKVHTLTTDPIRVKNGIESFGRILSNTNNIPLKCCLMIVFLAYADTNKFYMKAVTFINEQSTIPSLSKRLLSYYALLKEKNAWKEYVEQTFKTVWFAKDCTITDKECMVEVKRMLAIPNFLNFVK